MKRFGFSIAASLFSQVRGITSNKHDLRGSTEPPSHPTERETRIESLSMDVFSRGNVHLKNVETLTALPEGLFSFPEICFIGKPSVGKSTLISALLRNSRLAKGSVKPGTTRLLQFFNVGDALLLVDTPGYGGWKGRSTPDKNAKRANAFSILFRYLALRKHSNLKRVYWLMEASPIGPVSLCPRDEEILSFLMREEIPFSVVITKSDRYQRYDRQQREMAQHPAGVRVDRRSGAPIPLVNRVLGSTDPVSTPEENLKRNMMEIHDFLGTDRIPILAVSADRREPHRSLNWSALQHDIVFYCCSDLADDELTFEKLNELSYAPPLAEDVQRVQLRYPVESFVVPESNHLSLESMVRQHEAAKGALVGRLHDQGRLSAVDIQQLHLVNCSDHQEAGEREKHTQDAIAGLPRKTVLLPLSDAVTTAVDAPREAHDTSAVDAALPACLDPHSHYVTAINGVRIPRSMLSASIVKLAVSKEDELPAFAARSAAGAYEEILQQDAENDSASHFFLHFNDTAKLSEGQYDNTEQRVLARKKSMKHRRRDHVNAKYVDGVRKERSIHLQAEGFMCPWLAGAGQPRRQVVVGHGQQKKKNSQVMKGLKSGGFGGGRSYSARTMKSRGRATVKTGKWAT